MTVIPPVPKSNPLPFGLRTVQWTLFLLTAALLLLFLPEGAVQAGATCDIPLGNGSFACRNVPDYFMDNIRARDRLIAEIARRKQREHAGGPAFTMPAPLVSGTRGNYGYRCPDAQGECPNEWIPGPASSKGLSSPNRFGGSQGFDNTNTHIQRINSDGIGVKSIVDQRPIDAVDIWGDGAAGGGEVCFYGRGRLVFLDARTSPRAQSSLTTTMKGDHTCATIPGPGSVVFLPPG